MVVFVLSLHISNNIGNSVQPNMQLLCLFNNPLNLSKTSFEYLFCFTASIHSLNI